MGTDIDISGIETCHLPCLVSPLWRPGGFLDDPATWEHKKGHFGVQPWSCSDFGWIYIPFRKLFGYLGLQHGVFVSCHLASTKAQLVKIVKNKYFVSDMYFGVYQIAN